MAATGTVAPLLRLALLAATALVSGCSQSRPLAAAATAECQRCHGDAVSPAPPTSVLGFTDTSARPVGAHRSHLTPPADAVRAAIACDECHVVPTEVAGHYGDAAATVTFAGTLAGGRGTPRWDAATLRCDGVYCHGATLSGGSARQPLWTRVDGSQRACGSCHGDPPPSHAGYGQTFDCSQCHPRTVRPRSSPSEPAVIDLASGAHLDGTVDAPSLASCDGCHAAPPDTGAHRAHVQPASISTLAYGSLAVAEDVSPAGGTRYEFGCGHCHPTDPTLHLADAGSDGLPDVVLAPPATPVAGDEIKARNAPDAAWDATGQRCSGAYCHSSGQQTPAFVTSPAWNGPAGALGCDGCHANPPRYASGGAGADTANSHLDLDDFGYETGHFAGQPGPAHPGGSKHGGAQTPNPGFPNDPQQAAAPITCQACHAETAGPDPSGASAYFRDWTGDYALDERAEAFAGRKNDPSWRASQCTACHTPVREGAVFPLRHVNGRRDVVFDPRAALPAGYPTDVPALATNDLLRPYYVTDFTPRAIASDGAVLWRYLADAVPRDTADGTSVVYTTTLESATYDPATKTCASVGCHVGRQSLVDAGIRGPLRWGERLRFFSDPNNLNGSCGNCHNEAGPPIVPAPAP